MSFKQATLIGVCSAGMYVFLGLTSFLLQLRPGLSMPLQSYFRFVHQPLGLLANIGMLTFFIVLYQKQKDAPR